MCYTTIFSITQYYIFALKHVFKPYLVNLKSILVFKKKQFITLKGTFNQNTQVSNLPDTFIDQGVRIDFHRTTQLILSSIPMGLSVIVPAKPVRCSQQTWSRFTIGRPHQTTSVLASKSILTPRAISVSGRLENKHNKK